jgi:hypothetical protein
MEKAFISGQIDKKYKDGLDSLKKRYGQTILWHIEKAIRNYLISKKVLKE